MYYKQDEEGYREFRGLRLWLCARGERGKRGCRGFKPAASNPDTLPLAIIRPSNMAGGRKKHDQGDQTSAGAYLATYRQTVITCMANREI